MVSVPRGATIHLLEGTFVTRGIVPKSGWRLHLTDKTTLQLDVLESIPGQKWAIFGAGFSDSFSNIVIEGGVWDCNLQNQKIPMAAQAVAFITDHGNITVRNIKAINWGSTFKNAECFVIGVFNVGTTGKIAHNIFFDGIEVTQPAAVEHHGSSSLIGAHGMDPLKPKAVSPGWIRDVEIKNCYVHDFDVPVAVASLQMGSWCEDVHIHHNRVENLGPQSDPLYGCYLDTGASARVLVEENTFSRVPHGVYALLSTFEPVRNWTIRRNRIVVSQTSSATGIALHGFNTVIRHVLIEHNRIEREAGRNFPARDIVLSKTADATIRHNTFDVPAESARIIFEKGVTRAEVFNNRARNAMLIRPKSTAQGNAH